jgi:hypothetical protein
MWTVLTMLVALTLAGAVGWAFLGDLSRRWLPAFVPSGRSARPWILLAVTGCATLAGAIGWWIEPPERTSDQIHTMSQWQRALDAAYLALQHIFLNAPIERDAIAWILLSRVAALGTILLLAREGVTRLFSESILTAWLRLQSGHAVICGLGRTGVELVRHLTGEAFTRSNGARPMTVVVVEANLDNPLLQSCRELGVVVVNGDATDEKLLQRVGVARARHVCFVTGSDEANVEGACSASMLMAGRTVASAVPPTLIAHLRSADLATPLEEFVYGRPHGGADGAHRPVEVRAFNVLQQAAMEIVARKLLPIRPRDPSSALHSVIYGSGPIARSLALHIAEFAHYENNRRSRLTLVHAPEGREDAHRLLADHPALFPAITGADAWTPDAALDAWSHGVFLRDRTNPGVNDIGIQFVTNGGLAEMRGSPASPESIERLIEIARRGDAVPCVFLCSEDDERNCTLAFELRDELDTRYRDLPGGTRPIHIFAYAPHRPAYARITRRPGLDSFGDARVTCSFDAITWQPQRRLAELIAQGYHARYGMPQTEFWKLPLWERRSCYSAAIHVHAKLALLDLALVDARSPAARSAQSSRRESEPFSEPHRLAIALMEHNRWCAERLLDGWRYGPKGSGPKLRPSLVDWDNLSDIDREKDLVQALDLPNQCAKANGFALVPIGR